MVFTCPYCKSLMPAPDVPPMSIPATTTHGHSTLVVRGLTCPKCDRRYRVQIDEVSA